MTKKKRALAFIPEGAIARKGGTHTGPVTGNFQVWYVTCANGVTFRRCPYTPGGWKVANAAKEGGPNARGVFYTVKAQIDLGMLNRFVGVEPYEGYRRTVARDF